MNEKHFFDTIRAKLFNGTISTKQFEGIQAILKAWSDKGISDMRYISYALATAYHETAHTMQPVPEYGKGKGYDYGKKLKMSRKPYTTPNQIYYGRGFIQLTWYENYAAMDKILGIDLLNNPDLLLTPDISAKVMVRGMLNGDFTGKRLADYFNEKVTDPYNARRIINGLDKAKLIQGYYDVFHDAIYEC